MQYRNPVVPGFYPDPSVCQAYGKYYMVCSSFEYFPGVPILESDDLINWTQIGHVLTRPTQVQLASVPSSGGVFAPTIRFHDGRFYMVTTNDTTHENFYVWTDDIHGEWSDPITIDQGGIDPSLLFDEGKVYFVSNGCDDFGVGGVTQCEIDIATGRKLSPSKSIWQGTGGRYLESPHVYHIGDWYYLMAAEGGTEYGHMVVLARSEHVWGPYTSCPYNPILTNRNKAPFQIQGVGHGDLVQGPDGAWFMLTLGFRQIHIWQRFHHLGREVFLTPVRFEADGWLYCGRNGTVDEVFDISNAHPQQFKEHYTFRNTDWKAEWCARRCPDYANIQMGEDHLLLRSGPDTLDDQGSPTFMGLRQRAFDMELRVKVTNLGGEGGVTVYAAESGHYDLSLRTTGNGCEALLRLAVGNIRHIAKVIPITGNHAELMIRADALHYDFYLVAGDETILLGTGESKFLSNEVCSPFTGVVIGLYAQHGGESRFEDLSIRYQY